MAFVPQGQQSFGLLTARENLRLVADRYGAAGARRLGESLDLFPALPGLLGRRAGLLALHRSEWIRGLNPPASRRHRAM